MGWDGDVLGSGLVGRLLCCACTHTELADIPNAPGTLANLFRVMMPYPWQLLLQFKTHKNQVAGFTYSKSGQPLLSRFFGSLKFMGSGADFTVKSGQPP